MTATGTDCKGAHEHNGKTGMAMWDVYTIKGRRYTICAHNHGEDNRGYCGQLIDVTDLPAAVICCGRHCQ